MELSQVRKGFVFAAFNCMVCLLMQQNGIVGDGIKADSVHGGGVGTEVSLQQTFRQANRFKDLGTAIRAYGRDSHFGHGLQQAFFDGGNIVGFGRRIVLLYPAFLYKVVKNGVCHVRTKGRSTVSQQQRGVHNLTYFAALYDEGGLHALANVDKVMVYGAYGKQRRDGYVAAIDVAITKYDIVVSFVNAALCVLTKPVYSLAESLSCKAWVVIVTG